MENNIKFIVYCTQNLQNNKIYIGVHKTNPDKFDGYIGCGVYINKPSTYERSKTKFQYAVKKYGIKSFKRHTIAIYDSEEDAYALEESIVNENFLQRSDVYNLALGGTNGSYILTCRKIFQYSETGIFMKEYPSIRSAAIQNNRALISIWRAVKQKCKCKGFFWTDVKYEKLDLFKMHQYNGIETIPVFQYSKTGEYECCYNSIKDAARVLNKSSLNIGVAIKLGTLCYDKYFLKEFAPNYSIAKSDHIKSHEIHQYSLDGDYIASFKTMAEAKKKLGIKSDIYKAIRLGRTVGNFQWSFERLEKMPKILAKSGRARKVAKYDKKGTILAIYSSKASCKKENGSGVEHVLNGRDITHKGFYYKYLD